jgi:hypothetical protein
MGLEVVNDRLRSGSPSTAAVIAFSPAISSTVAASSRFASRFSPVKARPGAPEVVLVELVR